MTKQYLAQKLNTNLPDLYRFFRSSFWNKNFIKKEGWVKENSVYRWDFTMNYPAIEKAYLAYKDMIKQKRFIAQRKRRLREKLLKNNAE